MQPMLLKVRTFASLRLINSNYDVAAQRKASQHNMALGEESLMEYRKLYVQVPRRPL
jgi:hypothetical protein